MAQSVSPNSGGKNIYSSRHQRGILRNITDGLIDNRIISKTSQRLSDIESVFSYNWEMKNSHKPPTELPNKNKRSREEVVDYTELELIKDLQKILKLKESEKV